MKRNERHRLKRNEVVTWVSRASVWFERERKRVLPVLAIVVVVAVAWAGFSAWRAMKEAAASELLAEAIAVMNAPVMPAVPEPPATDAGEATTAPTDVAPAAGTYASERARLEAALPKFLAAAGAPSAGRVGVAAAYHAGATLAELGRFDEAASQYRSVMETQSAGIYGEVARLGLAEVLARQGDYQTAIDTWQSVSTAGTGNIPADGALMKLGQSYALAGQTSDALETFRRLVEEHPDSQYATEAREEIDALGGDSTEADPTAARD